MYNGSIPYKYGIRYSYLIWQAINIKNHRICMTPIEDRSYDDRNDLLKLFSSIHSMKGANRLQKVSKENAFTISSESIVAICPLEEIYKSSIYIYQ